MLPTGWTWAKAQDVARIVGGGTPSTTNPAFWSRGDIPWITPADLSGYHQKTISQGERNITRQGLDGSGAVLVPAGTVLFSSRAPIGYVAIAANAVATNQGFKNFVLEAGLLPDYVYYYLQYAKPLALGLASGTTFKEISAAKAAQLPVVVAPLREQGRIVEAIESCLSRLDAAVASLERVQAKLKAYRASVLKAAVEGRLVTTEAELARREGRTYEPADVLLARILKERRRRWEEAELARLTAAGKLPKDDRWKAKYEEPVGPDTSKLPALPEGWCWATLDSLMTEGPQNGIYVPRDKYGSGTPILRIDDYQVGWSRSSAELERVAISSGDVDKYSLRTGDIILNRVNSPSHLGKTLPIDARNVPAVFESNMMRFRLSDEVSPLFLHCYLSSRAGRQRLISGAKWAVNQASINQQDVRRVVAPLAPSSEQARIVAEIDRLLTTAAAALGQVEQAARRAIRLRQSVLSWAFDGRLVDQDPTDEPAEALLARIRAERAAVAPAKKVRARKAPRVTA